MKTKHNVFVSVGSQQEAERMEKVLRAMGEEVRKDFYSNTCLDKPDLELRKNGWILGVATRERTQITFGELIDILSKPDFYIYLEEAKQKYPKGTKFRQMTSKEQITSSGEFEIGDYGVTKAVYDKLNSHFVFRHNNEGVEWAEIVTEKIAVKVENEMEFKALMKYYDGLGFKHTEKVNQYGWGSTHRIITFYDNFQQIDESNIIATNQYTVIPFQEFAKKHNIKVPLLISEDGKELFEESPCVLVRKNLDGYYISAEYNFNKYGGSYNIHPKNPDNGVKRWIFSTKESALKWIEEQKPKEVEYVSDFGVKCQISKEESLINCGCGCFSLTKKDIQAIAKAMEDLKS